MVMEKDDSSPSQESPLQRLAFYATPEHECSYLQGRTARTLFADPYADLDNHTYSVLSEYGFRRSGKHIYRPSCPSCSACIPIRIPVADFSPNRNQTRVLKRNQAIDMVMKHAEYNREHHDLYRKYIQGRHPSGGMDNPDPEKYMEFLTSPWSITRFLEFRLSGKLIAVAVIDFLEQGLSAVYTFFDPEYAHLSPGTLAVLTEVELAQQHMLTWLYLGFWIPECQKMSYKSQFRPHQIFQEGHWKDHN